MNETTFELNGLSCADCAQKIENAVGKIEGVHSSSLSFATQKLNVIFGQGISQEALENNVKKIVSDLEPEVLILSENIAKNEKNTKRPVRIKKDTVLLAASCLLFAAGMLSGDNIASPAIFMAAWLVSGGFVIRNAVFNIAKGYIFDENLLMTVATVGAVATGQYPEAAAVMIFYKIGNILENLAVGHSRKSIAGLMDLRPEYATIKTDKGIMKVDPESVKAEDILLVKPGERIPVDSTILDGKSFVDTSSLTGESLPKAVEPGMSVLGGYINKSGLLTLRALNTLKQSQVTRVLELVQDAASRKAPMESFINRFAKYYTPAVMAAALLTAVLPPIVTGTMDFNTWLYRAMIFLVVSCPCALVVSIPLTFFAGIGRASSEGILVKGGNYLEALNTVGTVVFDKTGTLTEGVFSVSGLSAVNCTEAELLKYAAYAEADSTHPIARSIVAAYGKNIDESSIESSEEAAGKGIRTVLRRSFAPDMHAAMNQISSQSTSIITAGNVEYIKSFGVSTDASADTAMDANTGSTTGTDTAADRDTTADADKTSDTGIAADRDKGGTMVHVAVDGEYKGWIRVSDKLKRDSKEAVKKLREAGTERIVMLTGDAAGPAEAVANELELDGFHYGLLPHQKVELFEKLKRSSKKGTIFVGDGINDAPVLASADIGVSMGGIGSDAAIEASDIVLMTDEPSRIAAAFKVASLTRRIALQNVVFALSVKILVLLLGASGNAEMWEAVFADVGVTSLAVLNTLRIRRAKL